MMDLAARLAAQGHQVDQLALRSPKQALPTKGSIAPPPDGVRTQQIACDTRPTIRAAVGNLLFTSEPYHVTRHRSGRLKDLLTKLLLDGHYDVVQFESVHLLDALPVVRDLAPGIPVVLRAQNIEHRIWQGLAANATGPKRWYLTDQARRIERYESLAAGEVDHILALTDIDRDWFTRQAGAAPIEVVPLSIPVADRPRSPTPVNSFFHLAAMDWWPNQEGVEWFLREVWPMFRRKHPGHELHLAGTAMPDHITRSTHHDIKVQGTISDPVRYMSERGVMVVPLLSGSGLRVKILEGMGLGKTIISTTLGAAGIACQDGHDILLADTPAGLVAHMGQCAMDVELVARIGANALATARSAYSAERIGSDLERYYRGVVHGTLRRSARPSKSA